MVWVKCETPKEYCRARNDDGGCLLHTACEKIIDKCKGDWKDPENHEEGKTSDCSRIEGEYCKAYVSPTAKWRSRQCPLADHLVKETKKFGRRRIGQQKQRKGW